MSTKAHLNINEASKLCGLSPSVLRIWELRYGWPKPKRKPNGYRSYGQAQIEELKRMAELVRAGTPVSQLIIDELPRWPASLTHVAGPRRLPVARALPRPGGRDEAVLHDELVEALETRRGSVACEVLQRSLWILRPAQEVAVVLAPALVALAELHQGGTELPEAGRIRDLVRGRGEQLLRQQRAGSEEPLWIVPAHTDDHALAVVVALLVHQRGHAAKPWLGEGAPPAGEPAVVVGGDAERVVASEAALGRAHLVGRLTPLAEGDSVGLADLLHSDHAVPWLLSTTV